MVTTILHRLLSGIRQLFFNSKPLQEEKIPQKSIQEEDSQVQELLPLPKVIIETIISPYLEEESNIQLELLKYPQFFFMRNDPLHMSLLYHVVRGEQKEAERIIAKYPELLLKKGIVTDYSGRKIEGAAFQIALGADDADMWEMIEPYFKRLKGGEQKMIDQYLEQFPQDEEEPGEIYVDAFVNVLLAIRGSKSDQDCEAALEEFRNYLKPTDKVIKTWKHFNPRFLFRAFEAYDKLSAIFNADTDNRRNYLLWCKVIGYIQRFLPACYAQAFCHGFTYARCPDLKVSLKRSLKFQYEKDLIYFPLDSNPGLRLGYEYATIGGLCYGYWNKRVAGGYVHIFSPNGTLSATVHISSLFQSLYTINRNRQNALMDRLEIILKSRSAPSHSPKL